MANAVEKLKNGLTENFWGAPVESGIWQSNAS
jgi:hypothetical protein